MRFFVALVVGLSLGFTAALADQTDPSLDALFQELRDGTVIDAERTTERIVEIWARPANAVSAVLYERAELAFFGGDLDLAAVLADHMTGLSPNFAQGWVLRGSIDQAAGRLQGAIDAYTRAVELEPRHFLAHAALAEMLSASGNTRAAFDTYQRALEWNPHLEEAREEAARLRRKLTGQEI